MHKNSICLFQKQIYVIYVSNFFLILCLLVTNTKAQLQLFLKDGNNLQNNTRDSYRYDSSNGHEDLSDPVIEGNSLKDLKVSEYPFLVHLLIEIQTYTFRKHLSRQVLQTMTSVCTGTLVTEKTILTAGHCLYPLEYLQASRPLKAGENKRMYVKFNYKGVASLHRMYEVIIDHTKYHKNFIIHPNYNGETLEYDLGIIKIPNKLFYEYVDYKKI